MIYDPDIAASVTATAQRILKELLKSIDISSPIQYNTNTGTKERP